MYVQCIVEYRIGQSGSLWLTCGLRTTKMGGAGPVYDEARRQLLIFVQDLAREFNDAALLRSSTSRLANRSHQSGLALDDCIEHLYTARSVTQERSAAIRAPAGGGAARWQKHTMRYFFAVLADQLGLREVAASD